MKCAKSVPTPIGMNRRNFLRTFGGAAVAGTVRIPGLSARGREWERQPSLKARVAVLWEAGIPTVDASPVPEATLREAFADVEASFVGVAAFADRPGTGRFDLVVTPYGSAFPRQAFPALLEHLRQGGHWINLGGAPCAVPVDRLGSAWRREVRQVSLHRRLGITQSFPVSTARVKTWRASEECQWATALVDRLAPSTVQELYVRFTAEKDFPDEDGSAGQRDAVMRALVYGLDGDGNRVAAPFVAIDRLLGDVAGGRWVFATGDAPVDAPALRHLLTYGLRGGSRLAARPAFACYRAGESPSITITHVRPAAAAAASGIVECRLRLSDERGTELLNTRVTLADAAPTIEATVPVAIRGTSALPPGLYRVEVEASAAATPESTLRCATGFWVHDAALLTSGRPLGVDASCLTRDGQPFPVTGTTYMASDVQRQFLLEPNPDIWDRDFAAMKQAGVNLVRTGIWTGWKLLMPDVGTPDEGVVRAIDAFMLTARRHDIAVVFTFFAFLPEAWGGSNPYLDPRAIAAQKTFVTAIVRRCRGMRDLIWDLINEPSFSSSTSLWFTRPNGDEHEARAWDQWLIGKYPSATSEELDAHIQELWRLAPGESRGLPSPGDFEDTGVFGERRPLKAARLPVVCPGDVPPMGRRDDGGHPRGRRRGAARDGRAGRGRHQRTPVEPVPGARRRPDQRPHVVAQRRPALGLRSSPARPVCRTSCRKRA